MKKYSVYIYFPASELEMQVRANSLEDAIAVAETNGNKLLASTIKWNAATEKEVRVLGVIEQGGLS